MRGISGGAQPTSSRIKRAAVKAPASVAATAATSASIVNCSRIRRRVAPSETRVATSRLRMSVRDRKRLLALTHAETNSRRHASMETRSCDFDEPVKYSAIGVTTARWLGVYSFGYVDAWSWNVRSAACWSLPVDAPCFVLATAISQVAPRRRSVRKGIQSPAPRGKSTSGGMTPMMVWPTPFSRTI